MTTLKNKKLGLLMLSALLVSSTYVVAGGNGNGNEPPSTAKTGDSSLLCALLPIFCSTAPVTTNGGNGNGNEPD
jgi:hypothetical protein